MARLLLVAVLLALGASAPGCASDPPLDVASNVDLSQMQGKWYEIARLPRTTQTGCYGTIAFYTQQQDGTLGLVNQCNVGSNDGPLSTVSMTTSIPDPTVQAKLTLQVGGFSGDYWILEVGSSYEYAVVGHPSREYLWILSRGPTLDTPTLQGILNRAQANLFDTSKLQYTPQPPGNERDSLDGPQGSVPPPVTTGCSTSGAKTTGGAGAFGVLAVLGAASLRRRRRGRSCAQP